ncbi:hypothetical protein ACFLYB_03590 [Chloroflexota bacterium]
MDMDKEHKNYLAAHNPERRRWQNPEAILADIGLKPGLTFADIGCGGGFLHYQRQELLGKMGKSMALMLTPITYMNLKNLP